MTDKFINRSLIMNTHFLRIATTLLIFSALAYSAEWKFSSSINVAPNPVDAREQNNPRVAFDNDSILLVVWQQGKNEIGRGLGDIFAARITVHGTLLDNTPLVLCNQVELQERPCVSYNGSCFLVVWSDLRSGKHWDVYGARVSRDGTIMDPNGFVIAGGLASQSWPDVAPDGDSGFVVAYQSASTAGTIEDRFNRIGVASVRNNGNVTDFGDLPNLVGDSRGDKLDGGTVALASVGGVFYIGWRDHRHVAQGNGMEVGQYAVFSKGNDSVKVLSRNQADWGDMQFRFATDGISTAFITTCQVAGRGHAVYEPRAHLFNINTGATALMDPNPDDDGYIYHSRALRTIFPFWDIGSNGFLPMAPAYYKGKYVVLTRSEAYNKNVDGDKELHISAYISPATGVKTGATFTHMMPYPMFNLNAVGTPEGVCLVYENRESPTNHHIAAIFVKDTANDTVKPTVLSVSNTSATNLAVEFSEPIDKATAQTLSNYVLTGSVSVLSAIPGGDQRTVNLTTSAMTYNTNYTLTVSNVKDLADPQNTMNPASIDFTCVRPADIGNPSFESPVISGFQYRPTDPSWIFTGGAGIQHNGSEFQAPNAPDGVQGAFLQNVSSVTQQISLDSGTFQVKFQVARRGTNTQTVKVYLDSGEIGSITPSSAIYSEFISNGITVPAGSYQLKIAGTVTTGDNTAFVDNIRVAPGLGSAIESDVLHEEKVSLGTSPNPFNPMVNISVTGLHPGAELKIININGKMVANLTSALNAKSGKGGRSVAWDATGNASGVYVVVLRNGKTELRKKALLVR